MMTREETIEELDRLLSHWDDLENGKRSFRWYSKDAVEVAIAALRPVSRELVEADRVGHCVVFDLHYPVVSEYYKDEDGRYIREVSGVVSETKYKAALKEREQE